MLRSAVVQPEAENSPTVPQPDDTFRGAGLPPVGEPGTHHRPERALRYSHVQTSTGMGILILIAVAVALIFRTELGYWIVFAGVIPFFLLLTVLDLAIFNRWSQRFYTYTVSDDYVYITSGKFFRATKTLPTPHILAVETQQGPVQRAFDLMEVHFTTIAGQEELGPISPGDAERIRNQVTSVLVQADND